MDEKHLHYKDFYKQSITLPFELFRGIKLDIKVIGNFFLFLFVSGTILRFVPTETIFGIEKHWITFGTTAVLTFLSLQIDTKNVPFSFYLGYILLFAFKKIRRVSYVSFKECIPLKPVSIDWKTTFSDVTDTGKEILFGQVPLSGAVNDIRGLSLRVTGATRIRYNAFLGKISLETAKAEQLTPQSKEVKNARAFTMEIGRGQVRFLHKKGKTQAVYTPVINEMR